ncbi:MAG: hypothetical protein ABI251_05755 [Mycobacteriaceae bacterium]
MAAAIAVLVVALTTVLWARSEVRSTSSVTAAAPAPALSAATEVPVALTQAWQAPSGATTAPPVVGGVVVTADGAQVDGRNPGTGQVLWSYRRDVALCAATGQWNRAVAVYRSGRGCSDVTSLEGSTGARGPQRDSAADADVSLVGDGTYLASAGSTRMEVWRSDLVRTLEFGRVDAPVNPNSQPRPGCALRSVASSSQQVAVVLSCPGEQGDRLSLLSPAPTDPTKPTELGSTALGTSGARVIAVSGERTAVYLPGSPPRIGLYDGSANSLSSYPLPAEAAPQPGPPGLVEATTRTGTLRTWWTGSTLLALRSGDLSLAWSLPGALGPGATMAGQLLVPVPDGIVGVSAMTGDQGPTIPVERGPTSPQAIELAVAGSVILEQRGAAVIALK